jgi:hypothetical protein
MYRCIVKLCIYKRQNNLIFGMDGLSCFFRCLRILVIVMEYYEEVNQLLNRIPAYLA